jgi:integrase/recombinase XerD
MDLIQDYIDEFIFNCESRNLADGTIKRYKKMLKLFKDFLDSKKLTKLKIKALHIRNFLIAQKQKGRKESYINTHLKVIRALFVFLNEEEYLK